ncbi:MAG: transaldolase [Alphaproteobacteria bacterium]|nr:transaldolase [Alphaproteobacteria bacterium]
MTRTDSLNVKIFADGADLDGIRKLAQNPLIKGFTTNPTLMRKDGVSDYAAFAKDMLGVIGEAPVSFEVFADEFDEMEAQALEIASWGDNVYVKIPITNTKGESSVPLVERLSAQKVQVNVTAMMTLDQVRHVAEALHEETPAVVSVFAGRVADTGLDPVPLMREAVGVLESRPKAELLWASPRELLNIFHADEVGCHIITVTHDLLGKLSGVGKDLDQFSLETVQMFFDDASAAGYTIATGEKAAASG